MTGVQRNLAVIDKLLKLARADADAFRIDLADVARARTSAEDTLQNLDDHVRREEAAMKEAGVVDFANYMEGVRERRRNLQMTLIALTEAEEDAREKLQAAFGEIKKLEHLSDINARTIKKAETRADRAATDEIASLRVGV